MAKYTSQDEKMIGFGKNNLSGTAGTTQIIGFMSRDPCF